jgi:hypothetical protein
MGKKSTTRYVNHCLKLISDCGVDLNGDLKEEN